jgi:hypothetical protein
MKISRRVVFFILCAAIILLAGILFWPFILNEIIRPSALAVWLILRIFVLSIDQGYYWSAIIFVGFIFLCRLFLKSQTSHPAEEFIDSNEVIDTIRSWRIRFLLADSSSYGDKILKQELVDLLVLLYASKQTTTTNFEVYDALQIRQIPLPDHIHNFLFPEESHGSERPITKLLHSIRKTPQNWFRRWTGREKADHFRIIGEVLNLIETSLEVTKYEG